VHCAAGESKLLHAAGLYARSAVNPWSQKAIFAPNGMDISIDRSLNLLNHGKISLQGEFVWGSNYTFLVKLELQDESASGVYKPMRGERPLWDFPPTSLAKREVAAFLVSEALGWQFALPRFEENGPLGPGLFAAVYRARS
jgi:hypothetical protein